MKYTPENPMSIEQFKVRTEYLHRANSTVVVVALGLLAIMLTWGLATLIVPSPDLLPVWLFVIAAVITLSVASLLLNQAIVRIHREWHYYRGDVESVGVITIVDKNKGSYVPVKFTGDSVPTRFWSKNRSAPPQPSKRDVLVVRRIVKEGGSGYYEAA